MKITEEIYRIKATITQIQWWHWFLNGFEFFRLLENIVIKRSHNNEKHCPILFSIRELLMISEHVLDSIDFMLMASKSIFCIYHKHLYMTANIYIMFARTETLQFLYRSSLKRSIPNKISVHIVVFITPGYENSCYWKMKIHVIENPICPLPSERNSKNTNSNFNKISKSFEDWNRLKFNTGTKSERKMISFKDLLLFKITKSEEKENEWCKILFSYCIELLWCSTSWNSEIQSFYFVSQQKEFRS